MNLAVSTPTELAVKVRVRNLDFIMAEVMR